MSADPFVQFTTNTQSYNRYTDNFSDGTFRAITLGTGDLGEIRDILGIDGGVNESSSLYSSAHLVGGINGGAALGGAIGLLGKGRSGFEHSHFIPQRYLNRLGITRNWKSSLNETYVPRTYHALTDKYRYRFMPRSFKSQFGSSSFIPQGVQQVL